MAWHGIGLGCRSKCNWIHGCAAPCCKSISCRSGLQILDTLFVSSLKYPFPLDDRHGTHTNSILELLLLDTILFDSTECSCPPALQCSVREHRSAEHSSQDPTQQQARAGVWRGTRCCLVPRKEIKGVATSFRLNQPQFQSSSEAQCTSLQHD